MRPIMLILAVASSVITSGCGHAAIVQTDARSGEIAIDGAYMDSVSRARMLAIAHCGGPVALAEPANSEELLVFTCVGLGKAVVVADAFPAEASARNAAGW